MRYFLIMRKEENGQVRWLKQAYNTLDTLQKCVPLHLRKEWTIVDIFKSESLLLKDFLK